MSIKKTYKITIESDDNQDFQECLNRILTLMESGKNVPNYLTKKFIYYTKEYKEYRKRDLDKKGVIAEKYLGKIISRMLEVKNKKELFIINTMKEPIEYFLYNIIIAFLFEEEKSKISKREAFDFFYKKMGDEFATYTGKEFSSYDKAVIVGITLEVIGYKTSSIPGLTNKGVFQTYKRWAKRLESKKP